MMYFRRYKLREATWGAQMKSSKITRALKEDESSNYSWVFV